MKIITNYKVDVKFPFDKYINATLSVIPKEDFIGINKISIVEVFSKRDIKVKDSVAVYIKEQEGNKASIEINIIKLLERKIPKYLFDFYYEIAGLFLSEVLIHEIGHHVHYFKKHGIKKGSQETYADKYAKAGYYNYLKSRQSKIFSSYKWASRNIFYFKKNERKSFSIALKELRDWIEENKNGIPYP